MSEKVLGRGQPVVNKIAIMTDSNSGITGKEAMALGVYLIPMPFFINETEYFEDQTITQTSFFEKMEADAEISTSQPAPGALLSMWQKALESHEMVVYIPMSSGLSSACMTAMALSADFDGRVLVVDNKRISVTQRQSVLEAVTLVKQGYTGEMIKNRLEEYALGCSIYITVDTLKYLKKGGRITATTAAIGTVLNIKPVLQIQGDKLDAYQKARGRKQAIDCMITALKNDIQGRFAGKSLSLYVAYSGDPDLGAQWKQTAQEAFPDYTLESAALPLSIACHTGAGAIGIGCVEQIPTQY